MAGARGCFNCGGCASCFRRVPSSSPSFPPPPRVYRDLSFPYPPCRRTHGPPSLSLSLAQSKIYSFTLAIMVLSGSRDCPDNGGAGGSYAAFSGGGAGGAGGGAECYRCGKVGHIARACPEAPGGGRGGFGGGGYGGGGGSFGGAAKTWSASLCFAMLRRWILTSPCFR
ncbi:hypothetical protein OF83DRAFT_1155752 [Amylostereum chailletii]|nr:hypothetical protein OF83DRAFT_1155752 [Amylostereum chailletii]